jgi:hypothetical protein
LTERERERERRGGARERVLFLEESKNSESSSFLLIKITASSIMMNFIVTLLLLLAMSAALSAAAAAECLSEKDLGENCTLADLPDAALLQICTDRGFALDVPSDVDIRHEDYVMAAEQCMDIDAEMQKMLEEDPDLVKELQAEEERMKEEEVAAAAAQATAAKTKGSGGNAKGDDGESKGEAGARAAAASESKKVIQREGEQEGSNIAATLSSSSSSSIRTETNTAKTEKEEGEGIGGGGKVEEVEEVEKKMGDLSRATILNPAGFTFKEIFNDFRKKVLSDLDMVGKVLLPVPMRKPLANALKPPMRLVKRALAGAFFQTKRYASSVLQDLRNR